MNVASSKQLPESFRIYLQGVLLERCRANPRYSLRNFAKTLQINHSSLSRILSGERPVSEKLKLRLGLRLGLTLPVIERFKTDENDSAKLKTTSANYKQLTLDSFAVIADWYHYAILELMAVESFQSDPKWIARSLGISVTEARAGLERLSRLGFITANSQGRWINSSGSHTNIGPEMKAAAHRRLQAQVLQMALTALEQVPLERRNQTSMTIAIQTRRIPEAIEKITKFRREMCAFFEEDSKRDQVYQLGISFYPLTQNLTNEGVFS